jgi:hypothetical protein
VFPEVGVAVPHDLLRDRFRERTLARLWREEAPRWPWLECADGRKLRVLYPGMPAPGIGPDFRGAMLQTPEGTVLRGDVELHLRPGGWREHRHHADARYNSIVLHVVLRPDRTTLRSGSQTLLEVGALVPILSLFPVMQRLRRERRMVTKAPEESGHQASGLQSTASRPASLEDLTRWGEVRFTQKARAFRQRIGADGPDQALYAGLMEAMGYHQNRAFFAALALRAPYAALRHAVLPVESGGRAALTERLLLEASYMLPSLVDRSPSAAVPTHHSRWPALQPCRPANHPRRRIAGIAVLLARAWEPGLAKWAQDLVEGLAGAVSEASINQKSLRKGVEKRFLAQKGPLATPSQKVLKLDPRRIELMREFLCVRESGGRGTLIGNDRADEVAVNILLPWAYALGAALKRPGMARAAQALYRAWPAIESNHLAREAAAFIGVDAGSIRMKAREQQGLMHLYRMRTGHGHADAG